MSKEEQYNFALLNSAMYDPNPKSVLDKVKRGSKYTILEENVNDMVVKDKNTGKIILVIKGTDISDKKGMKKDDLIQDLGILLNNKDMVTRTKQMENKTEELIKKYGKENIILTGHSLAGYIVSEISGYLDVNAIAFNTGSSPFNRNRYNRVKGNNTTTHYTTNVGSNFDPVSLTAARVDNYNRIQVEPNQEIGSGILKYHTIDHFLEDNLKKIKNNNIDNNKIMQKSSFENKEKTKNARRRQKFYMRKAISREMNLPAKELKGRTFEQLRTIIEKNQLEDVMDTIRRADKLLEDDDEEEVKGVMEDMKDMVEEMTFIPEGMMEEDEIEDKMIKRSEKLKKKGFIVPSSDIAPLKSLLPYYESENINDNGRDINSELNDNFIRGVNSYSSFQTNPSIPVRRQFRYIGRQIENTPMRVDPDPSTYPEESLLQQNAMLEGRGVMSQVDPESSRGNLSYATTNMASYEQNQMIADTRNIRRRTRKGDPDDDDDDDDDFSEDEGKYDRDDDRLFDQDDENELNNRERVELELEMESSRNLGRWSGDNRSRLNDFQRAARDKIQADSMRDSTFLNSLREKPIPWQKPSRTYQNNSVGLIRNSNRSMQLAVSELIP